MCRKRCGKNDALLVLGLGVKKWSIFCFHCLGALTHHVKNFRHLAGLEEEGAHRERERDRPWRMKDFRDRDRHRGRERPGKAPTLLIALNEVLDVSVKSSWVLRSQPTPHDTEKHYPH